MQGHSERNGGEMLFIWKQFLKTGSWEVRLLEDKNASVVIVAASFSMASAFACNKISYKNSASLISLLVGCQAVILSGC